MRGRGGGWGMFTRADAVTWNELNSCESRKTCSHIVLGVGCVDVSEKNSAYFPSNVKVSSPSAF